MNFVDKILAYAATNPNKPALMLGDRSIGYGKLAGAIAAAEQRIRGAGLPPGALVGILIDSPIRHLTLIIALYRAGMVSVSLRIGFDFTRAGLRIDATLRDAEGQPAAGGGRDIAVDAAWFEPAVTRSTTAATGFAPNATCRVLLSSGTTGYPKAIGLTAADVESRLTTYAVRAGSGAWDRLLCLPGLSTNYGFSFALMTLVAGKSLCFAASVAETLRIIPLARVDLMIASTQHLSDIVKATVPESLPTLQAVQVGGNVMSRQFLDLARLRVCRNIICAYGSTEAGTVAYATAEAMAGIEGAVGIVAAWARVEAVDDKGRVLSPGEAGTIRIRAEGQGHTYGLAVADDNFKDGWFYPGDRGTVDASGMLIILGRSGELINAGGAKVAPELVEELVLAFPGIKDAAALAMADTAGIEELWVAVVADTPIDERALIAHCAQRNSDFRPARVKFVSAIPRSALGKVARDTLRRQLRG
ncbi:MAG TPA: fatty acid--CoA ligase family protein [Stellaceae bacterium]|nr:fatty acid--CoA ligase family protein [Stellaceae bacterium]